MTAGAIWKYAMKKKDEKKRKGETTWEDASRSSCIYTISTKERAL